MKRQDERSVGELLLDADFTSRQILMDFNGDDAPAMLRTWGEVVQSAAELWATLPQPFLGTTTPLPGLRPEAMAPSGQFWSPRVVRLTFCRWPMNSVNGMAIC